MKTLLILSLLVLTGCGDKTKITEEATSSDAQYLRTSFKVSEEDLLWLERNNAIEYVAKCMKVRTKGSTEVPQSILTGCIAAAFNS
jgi:hypothetical protein